MRYGRRRAAHLCPPRPASVIDNNDDDRGTVISCFTSPHLSDIIQKTLASLAASAFRVRRLEFPSCGVHGFRSEVNGT